jgi:hypothetical protein
VARLPANIAAVIMLAEILVATFSAWMLGAAEPAPQDLIGGVLIIAAPWIVRDRRGRAAGLIRCHSAGASMTRLRPGFLGLVERLVGGLEHGLLDLGGGRLAGGDSAAAPMEALMRSGSREPSIITPRLQMPARMRSAMRAASSRVACVSSTTNSSPPKRPSASERRSSFLMRAASRSTSSPLWWPNWSLTRLKWSMSMNRQDSAERSRWLRATSSCMRCSM